MSKKNNRNSEHLVGKKKWEDSSSNKEYKGVRLYKYKALDPSKIYKGEDKNKK